MNRKVRDILFLLICVAVTFNNIPKPIQLNWLGGPVAAKLVIYPLLAAWGYSFWCRWKGRMVFADLRPFLTYILIYLAVMLLSTVVGLYTYPYYEQVLSGPADQIEKLPGVLTFFHAHGVAVNEKLLMQGWIVVRQLKSVVWEAFWCFGGAYLLYCWYREEWKCAVRLLGVGILISAGCIIAYSCIELFYLAHEKWAEQLLCSINPYIHAIKTDGKWWPPLLWKGALRSLFAEASYYGIFMAFALPWLWKKIWEADSRKRQILFAGITACLTFFLFLTKARTAVLLHAGELLVLAGLLLSFYRNKKTLVHYSALLTITAGAFFAGNLFIMEYQAIAPMPPVKTEAPVPKAKGNAVPKKDVKANEAKGKDAKPADAKPKDVKAKDTKSKDVGENINRYVQSNAWSLANPDARSNRARYSVMEADLKVGLDHPVLGVGKGLRSSYIPDYFLEKALQNAEVKMWLRFREKLGIMRSGIPPLGEYTGRFAETGAIGLCLFLAPFLYLLAQLLRRFCAEKDVLPYIFYTVSLVGMLAAGIGDTFNITWCHWLLLGLGYAMCYGRPGNERLSDE